MKQERAYWEVGKAREAKCNSVPGVGVGAVLVRVMGESSPERGPDHSILGSLGLGFHLRMVRNHWILEKRLM